MKVAVLALLVTIGIASCSGHPSTTSTSPTVIVLPAIHLDPAQDTGSLQDDRVERIRGVEHGAVVAHLTVAKLKLIDYPVRFGITLDILAKGPGLYPGSAAPGDGNFAMAGHRITPVGPFRTCSTGEWGTPDCHGPFRYVNLLHEGDTATVVYRGKTYRYAFVRTIIVDPTDVSVLKDGRADMTFTACHPPGFATNRIVAQWDLVS